MARWTKTAEERFSDKIDKTLGIGPHGECWLWRSAVGRGGYGTFWYERAAHYAHRFAYELANGLIPDGLDILHSCDNPMCVNPAHLSPGTHKQNMADMAAKGRQRGTHGKRKTHCVRGHELTDENVSLSNKGARNCKQCQHERNVAVAAKQKMVRKSLKTNHIM